MHSMKMMAMMVAAVVLVSAANGWAQGTVDLLGQGRQQEGPERYQSQDAFITVPVAQFSTLASQSGRFSSYQYEKIREMLAFEAQYGTRATAFRYTNTFWVPGGEPMGREFYNAHIPTPYGPVDLDWFTDVRCFDGGGLTSDAVYQVGKGGVQRWVRAFATGRPAQSFINPYEDVKERQAMFLLRNGVRSYGQLFPSEFMKQMCPEELRQQYYPEEFAAGRAGEYWAQ